jgi:hypothetical protein
MVRQRLQAPGYRAAVGPIQQLHGVDDRQPKGRIELCDAPDIAGGDDIRAYASYIGDLALAQLGRDLRLEDVVGAGGPSAQVTLRVLR